MRRLIWSDDAEADLDALTDYIAKDSVAAAIGTREEIHSQVEQLQEFPYLGRSGRLKGTRELVVTGTPFVVIYMVPDTVEVLRVVHGAQRWPEKPGRLR